MLTSINPDSRVEFTSKHDKTEPKTGIVLRPLIGMESLAMEMDHTDIKGSTESMIKASVVAIRDPDISDPEGSENSEEKVAVNVSLVVEADLTAKVTSPLAPNDSFQYNFSYVFALTCVAGLHQ